MSEDLKEEIINAAAEKMEQVISAAREEASKVKTKQPKGMLLYRASVWVMLALGCMIATKVYFTVIDLVAVPPKLEMVSKSVASLAAQTASYDQRYSKIEDSNSIHKAMDTRIDAAVDLGNKNATAINGILLIQAGTSEKMGNLKEQISDIKEQLKSKG